MAKEKYLIRARNGQVLITNLTMNKALKNCETGFDLIIVADNTSGHTMEFKSVKEGD